MRGRKTRRNAKPKLNLNFRIDPALFMAALLTLGYVKA